MRPSGAKAKAVISSSIFWRGLSRSWAWTEERKKKELTQSAQRAQRTRRKKWRVASGEWRDKGEERFLASLGMTVRGWRVMVWRVRSRRVEARGGDRYSRSSRVFERE